MPVRTIAIAIAEVIEGGTKSEFYVELRSTLDTTRRAANIASTECLRLDNLAETKPPKLYTYPVISGMFPGACTVAASIGRSVEKSYVADRWQMIRGIRSNRQYRSFPWPLLCNKSTKLLQIEDAGEYLTAKIRLLNDWWTVRLAGGARYRDQVRGLRKAIATGGVGDSKIWIDQRNHKAIIGVACRMDAVARKELSGEMYVASSRDHLLVATFERSDVPFVINADICKKWQSEANSKYQRLRQDRKSDADRRRIRRDMNAIASKNNRRMKTLCHEVAARIVNKAIRMRVESIKLDLTIKSYAQQFPWFDLAGKIKYKAESAGIKLVDATQSVSEPDVNDPHVYFKLAPISKRIKIGMTGREDGGRHGTETDSPEALVILAVDNQPKSKLRTREKHYHAMFQEHRVVGEWFQSEPILAWLREVGWLGNAGNLSQIMQVLGVSKDTIPGGLLQANGECSSTVEFNECSQNAERGEDIALPKATALAVTQRTFWD